MTPHSPGSDPTGLGDLLHDLAEKQPAVRVDPDTWRRGRRAHRRRQVVTAVASLAAVTLVTVGGLALVRDTGPDLPDVAGGPGVPLALPDRVHEVPTSMFPDGEGASWSRDLAAGTLQVGPAAVAYTADSPFVTGAVVVSAVDGRYRGLDLPGLDVESSFSNQDNVVALSADGTRLAYAWREPDRPGVSGVRVLDLTGGEVTDHPLPSDVGVVVGGLGWSPDQRYLAFNAAYLTDRNGGTRDSDSSRVLRLDLTTDEVVRVPGQSVEATLSVNDQGEVTLPRSGPAQVWRPTRRPALTGLGVSLASMVWAPDGRRIAVGGLDGDAGVSDRSGTGLSPLEADQSEIEPDEVTAVDVIGWVSDDEFAARSTARDAVITQDPYGGPERTLLEIDPGVTHPSFATDLLGVPTRDYPTPDWVERWYDRPVLRLAGVVGVALLVLGSSVVRRRRR